MYSYNGLNSGSYGQNMYPQTNYQQTSYVPNNANYGLKNYGLQFATRAEMDGLILPPGAQVMALRKEGDLFYIKSADNLGRSTLKEYTYKETEQQAIEQPKQEYVTKDAFDQLKKEFETFIENYKNQAVGVQENEQPK